MAECCVHGICEVKDSLVGNEQALTVLRGLVNKSEKLVRKNPEMGVRELTEAIADEDVTLQDVMAADREPDPISYYMKERDGGIVPGTDLPFSQLALAVATCVTRATTGVCEVLYPIEIGTVK